METVIHHPISDHNEREQIIEKIKTLNNVAVVSAASQSVDSDVNTSMAPFAYCFAACFQMSTCNANTSNQNMHYYGLLVFEGLSEGLKCGSRAGWLKQLITLTNRSFVNMSKDIGYYWLRIFVYIALSFCVGTVFFNVRTNNRAILAHRACGGYITGFMTIMSIGGFPSFIEEMKIFGRERMNRHYGVGVFTVSNFVASFSFLAVMSLGSVTITYIMVGFQPGFTHFLYGYLDLFIAIAVVESYMMIVASLVPNFLMGIIAGAGLIGIMMMYARFFRLMPDLPVIFWQYPISYINYMAWTLEGAFKNDMIGLEFEPREPGEPKLKGENILKSMLGMSLQHSKWWDLAVIGMLIFCRLFFFVILKLKERALPMLHNLLVIEPRCMHRFPCNYERQLLLNFGLNAGGVCCFELGMVVNGNTAYIKQ